MTREEMILFVTISPNEHTWALLLFSPAPARPFSATGRRYSVISVVTAEFKETRIAPRAPAQRLAPATARIH
jgi:hypothetical protein